MKKLIALVLVITTLVLTLTGCFWREDDTSEEYCWGDEGLGFPEYQHLNAKVTSDKLEFDINDVTLDFYYCFYCLDDETIEEVKSDYHYGTGEEYWEATYAIYLSNTSYLMFEGENDRIIDYENKVNAQLIKYIDHKELFDTNYGYTIYGINVIEYNHMEELTIPAEFFAPSYGTVYIHIIQFAHFVENDILYRDPRSTTIMMEFNLLDESTVILRER